MRRPQAARRTRPGIYLDPALQEQQRQQLFARSWQWLGDLAESAAPGSLVPLTCSPIA